MAYVVTKTVKGRRYLYLQRSYRVGKKVKTESVFLGAVRAGAAGAMAVSRLMSKMADVHREAFVQTPKGQEWVKEVEAFRKGMDEWVRWSEAQFSAKNQASKAQKAYDDLREQNQREVRDYWQKVEEHNARDTAANEAWKAEHASSDAPQPQASQSDAVPEG